MDAPREQLLVGGAYLEAITELLQRCRKAHPTKGQYEPGEMLWWWAEIPRPTDSLEQLFWLDESGVPEAAIVLTDWREWVSMDPIVTPDADPEWVAHVVERGLAHAHEAGLESLQLEVDSEDIAMHEVLTQAGFAFKEEAMIEAWLDADRRPPISPLAEDYRLFGRNQTQHLPHHMAARHHPDLEQRLLETPLYRADLDLVVLDENDEWAAYGLCWYDEESRTGAVEPMRTDDAHQRKGLARHILTSGIARLAEAGAERIKIVFEPDNPASSHLYPDVGFEPAKRTDTWAR